MYDIKRTAAGTALILSAAIAHAGTGDLELQLTVGTDLSAGACAETTSIEVGYGDPVNLCYRIVNHGDQTLRYHTLHDDALGRLLTLDDVEVPPGGSHQFNRLAGADETRTIGADWRALAAAPTYTVEASDPAVLFADGFEGGDPVRYAFVDISQTGEELIIPSNMEWVPVELPFQFDFYGIASNRLRMVEFGAVGWDPIEREDNAIRYLPQPILDSLGPGLYPYWTDMFDSGGRFFYQVMGQAPNRRAVLQWHELHYDRGTFPASGTVTFQLMLEEGTNRIWFNYEDASFGDEDYDYGRAATVGLGAGANGLRLQYSRNQASLSDYFTLRFTPNDAPRLAASAQVHLDVGAPVIEVDPPAVSATVTAGGSGSAPLAIGNVGTRDLQWSLGEAPPRMHFPSTSRANVAETTLLPTPLADSGAPAAPRGAAVPAFAWMDTTLEALVSLDVASPQNSLEVIDDALQRIVMAGDFIGNDFEAIYMLDWWSDQLLRVLTEFCNCVGQVTVIGPPGNPAGGPRPREGEWVGMSYDGSNDTLYASAYYPGYRRSTLYRIDRTAISAWELGQITGVPGNGFGHIMIQEIAVSPEGLMYGVEAFADNLVAIDKVTGEAAVIGPLGIDLPNGYRPQIGLDFDDATGTLYLAANLNIYTVDTATGFARIVGSTGEFPLDSLAIATTSPCSRPEDISWLTLGGQSGSNAPEQWSTLALGFDAAGLAPGEYTAKICVASNDPLRGRVIVPVTLSVE